MSYTLIIDGKPVMADRPTERQKELAWIIIDPHGRCIKNRWGAQMQEVA